MQSPKWALTRQIKLENANWQCERCGRRQLDGWILQCHHWTYERLGNEDPDDLEILCEEHHRLADNARRDGLTRDEWPAISVTSVGRTLRVVRDEQEAHRYGIAKDRDGTYRVGISLMRSEAVAADGILDPNMARGLAERLRDGGIMQADLAIIRATQPRQEIEGF
jgi:hypothetical protein